MTVYPPQNWASPRREEEKKKRKRVSRKAGPGAYREFYLPQCVDPLRTGEEAQPPVLAALEATYPGRWEKKEETTFF